MAISKAWLGVLTAVRPWRRMVVDLGRSALGSPFFKLDPDLEWLRKFGEIEFIFQFVNLQKPDGHVSTGAHQFLTNLAEEGVDLLKRVDKSPFFAEQENRPAPGSRISFASAISAEAERWTSDWTEWLWKWSDLASQFPETRSSPFACRAVIRLIDELGPAGLSSESGEALLKVARLLRPRSPDIESELEVAMARASGEI